MWKTLVVFRKNLNQCHRNTENCLISDVHSHILKNKFVLHCGHRRGWAEEDLKLEDGNSKGEMKDDAQATADCFMEIFIFNSLCLQWYSKLLSTSWADYLLTLFQLTNTNKIQLRYTFSFFIAILHFASKSTLHKLFKPDFPYLFVCLFLKSFCLFRERDISLI